MTTDFDRRLGQRIRAEREARGWTLQALADRSGVSTAMINKVERAESSPTAALLGRLSGAFGLTMSSLLARIEGAGEGRLLRAAGQPRWTDPETGYTRRQVAPVPGSRVPIDLVEVELPAGAAVAYPAASYRFIRQIIALRSGVLHFTEGMTEHVLAAGDCLELGDPADCRFFNPGPEPCLYLVALLRL